MGKKKKERQKRQSVLGQVKKIHQKTGEPKRGYAFQLIGAFFCDFFYYTGHILKWFVLTGLILTAAVSIVLFVRFGDDYRSFEKEADQIVENSKAEDFRMDEVTYIYGADGGQIAELSSGNGKSSYLNYRQIPKYAVDAFVAIEDRSYWRNIGIDMKGIIRVAFDFVTSRGDNMAGASTITQQLARTIYLTRDRSITRKIKEMMVSIRLTRKYSKEDIMEFYVNTACFSNGIYGLEAAAKAFFGNSASQLSLSQIAYLCAIPNRPEYFNPYKHPKRALERRDKILKDMYTEGYISKSAYEKACKEKIKVRKQVSEFNNYETTYAVYCATEYLMKLHGFDFRYQFKDEADYQSYQESYESAYNLEKSNLYAKGYTVETSLRPDAQQALQQALDNNLADIQKKGDKLYCNDRFKVASIGYNDSREIVSLVVVNTKGDCVYAMQGSAASGTGKKKAAKKKTPEAALTDSQMSDLQAELDRTGVAMETVQERYKIGEPETMSEAVYRRVMEALAKTKSAA